MTKSTTLDPKTTNDEGERADAPAAMDVKARLAAARDLRHRYVLLSLGAGVIPFPALDLLALSSTHLGMLRGFSRIYNVEFKERLARKVIMSLLGSAGVLGIGAAVGSSLAKLIPGIGTTISMVSLPVLAGATTHALANVMILHFESGGTLLDLDPLKMRAYFKEEFERAKDRVGGLQGEGAAASDETPP